MKNIKKSTLFIGLTLFVSWSMIGIYYLLGGELTTITGTIVTVLYMFVPMSVALIIQKLIHKQPVIEPLKIKFNINKWFLIAWLITPIMAFLTIGISIMFPDISFSLEMAGMFERFENLLTPEEMAEVKSELETLPVHPIWITLIQGLIAGISVNAIAGFGEELGWRGFLLKEYSNLKFWKASIFIGFIWGLWHAPIILQGHNYPEHPIIGVFMMILWCILLTPIFIYITIKAKSVIAAAILHGTLNATAGIAIMLVAGGSDLTVGMTGIPGFVVLIIVLILLYIYDNKIAKEKLMSEKIDKYL